MLLHVFIISNEVFQQDLLCLAIHSNKITLKIKIYVQILEEGILGIENQNNTN